MLAMLWVCLGRELNMVYLGKPSTFFFVFFLWCTMFRKKWKGRKFSQSDLSTDVILIIIKITSVETLLEAKQSKVNIFFFDISTINKNNK